VAINIISLKFSKIIFSIINENCRVMVYFIYSMGIARHREVKIFSKKLKHSKKENYLTTLTLRTFREMMAKKYRAPDRQRSNLNQQRRPSSGIGVSDLVRRQSSRVTAELQRRNSTQENR
jgi:hypothetical protein